MGELRAWAIDIATVRRLTPASPELAGRLRGIAAERFRVPEAESRSPGLLSKLGPLLKVPYDAPRLPPGMPSHNDVEHLVAGRFVTPDQLPKAWTVLRAWLDELSWGSLEFQIDNLDELELDLARAGLPAEFGVRRLLCRDAELLVRPLPGERVGWSTHDQVLRTHRELGAVLGHVESRSSMAAHRLAEHLAHYGQWSRDAHQAGRPAPDLVAVLS